MQIVFFISALICLILAALLFRSIRNGLFRESSQKVQTSMINIVIPNINIAAWKDAGRLLDELLRKYPWRAKRLSNLIVACLTYDESAPLRFENPYIEIQTKFGPKVKEKIENILNNLKKGAAS